MFYNMFFIFFKHQFCDLHIYLTYFQLIISIFSYTTQLC